MMGNAETVALERDVEAAIVPSGTRVTLQKGESATIMQSLGGTYTVTLNGNMFRIDGTDADALGKKPDQTPAQKAGKPESEEDLEKQVWDQMKTCYDPEIPVDIYELGLIYEVEVDEESVEHSELPQQLPQTDCPHEGWQHDGQYDESPQKFFAWERKTVENEGQGKSQQKGKRRRQDGQQKGIEQPFQVDWVLEYLDEERQSEIAILVI